MVELAIGLTIIGVLLGGVLVGQNLIVGSRLSSTLTQIRSIEAGALLFRDRFNALPGDIGQPNVRIPYCMTMPCSLAGNGNGQIGGSVSAALTVGSDERLSVWAHLLAGGFLSGFAASNDAVFGGGAPAAPFRTGSGFRIGFGPNIGALAGISATTLGHPPMHYVAITSESINALSATSGLVMTPATAQRLDQKLDDGNPNTGTVLAAGAVNATTGCVNDATPAGVYNDPVAIETCFSYVGLKF